jgi:hypothetical protein
MGLKGFLLSCLVCTLAAGCDSDHDNNSKSTNDSTSDTSSSSEEQAQWSSVYYSWTSNWDACTNNKLSIKRDRQISSNRCGKVQRQTLNTADFAEVEALVNRIVPNFGATLNCDGEAIMDYAVFTYLTVGDATKQIYQFDDEKKCSRGDRTATEQLQETLEIMHDKYVPDSRSTEN